MAKWAQALTPKGMKVFNNHFSKDIDILPGNKCKYLEVANGVNNQEANLQLQPKRTEQLKIDCMSYKRGKFKLTLQFCGCTLQNIFWAGIGMQN